MADNNAPDPFHIVTHGKDELVAELTKQKAEKSTIEAVNDLFDSYRPGLDIILERSKLEDLAKAVIANAEAAKDTGTDAARKNFIAAAAAMEFVKAGSCAEEKQPRYDTIKASLDKAIRKQNDKPVFAKLFDDRLAVSASATAPTTPATQPNTTATSTLTALQEAVKLVMTPLQKDGKKVFTDQDVEKVNATLKEYYEAAGKDLGGITNAARIGAIAQTIAKEAAAENANHDTIAYNAVMGLVKKGKVSEADMTEIETKLRQKLPANHEFKGKGDDAKNKREAAVKTFADSKEHTGTGMRVGATIIGAIAAFLGLKWLLGSKEEVDPEDPEKTVKKPRSMFARAMGTLVAALGITAVVAVGVSGQSPAQVKDNVSTFWRDFINKGKAATALPSLGPAP